MKAVRGYFTDQAEARRAMQDLHAAGFHEIRLHDEPEYPMTAATSASATPAIAYTALIGAGLAFILGLAIGMLGTALPNVNREWSNIVVMLLTWSIGSALVGAVIGAIYGAVFQRGLSERVVVSETQAAGAVAMVRVMVPGYEEAEQARSILQAHHGDRIDTLGAGRTVV